LIRWLGNLLKKTQKKWIQLNYSLPGKFTIRLQKVHDEVCLLGELLATTYCLVVSADRRMVGP
jgi:hypothetical protein